MAQAAETNIIPFPMHKAGHSAATRNNALFQMLWRNIEMDGEQSRPLPTIEPANRFSSGKAPQRDLAGVEARAILKLCEVVDKIGRRGEKIAQMVVLKDLPRHLALVRDTLPNMSAMLERLMERIEASVDSIGDTLTFEEGVALIVHDHPALMAHRNALLARSVRKEAI